jgi:hypothetical protein
LLAFASHFDLGAMLADDGAILRQFPSYAGAFWEIKQTVFLIWNMQMLLLFGCGLTICFQTGFLVLRADFVQNRLQTKVINSCSIARSFACGFPGVGGNLDILLCRARGLRGSFFIAD